MKLAFAATMIRPRYLPDSIIARKVSASAFLHSLDPERTLGPSDGLDLGAALTGPLGDLVVLALDGIASQVLEGFT